MGRKLPRNPSDATLCLPCIHIQTHITHLHLHACECADKVHAHACMHAPSPKKRRGTEREREREMKDKGRKKRRNKSRQLSPIASRGTAHRVGKEEHEQGCSGCLVGMSWPVPTLPTFCVSYRLMPMTIQFSILIMLHSALVLITTAEDYKCLPLVLRKTCCWINETYLARNVIIFASILINFLGAVLNIVSILQVLQPCGT